jgi:hypothetical protein
MIVDGKKFTLTETHEVTIIGGDFDDYWLKGARGSQYILRVWTNGKAEMLPLGHRKGWSKVTTWSVN